MLKKEIVYDDKQSKKTNGYIVDKYTLYDKFTTDVAAGSVNATNAEPVGGARGVLDTNTKISIVNGKITFATGAVADADGLYYLIQTRVLGKCVMATLTPTSTNINFRFGWDVNTTGIQTHGIDFWSSGRIADRASGAFVGTYTATPQQVLVVMRTNGSFIFIKSETYTNWTFLSSGIVTAGNMYPRLLTASATETFTADNIRVPKRLFIPVPLESDGMSGSVTDGLGHAESATNGSQVSGHAYTNVGTWGVASGARSCSALSGGLGFSYLTCTSSNVIIDVEVTRGAGVAGLVARYADASNYLIAYHDGTNAKLDKVVAGSTTSLISAAATYSAGAVLRLILDGTSARLFYNNAAVGTVATTPAAGSLNHGLYTTDILSNGNSFDDLIIWARGNEGQYSGLDSL